MSGRVAMVQFRGGPVDGEDWTTEAEHLKMGHIIHVPVFERGVLRRGIYVVRRYFRDQLTADWKGFEDADPEC